MNKYILKIEGMSCGMCEAHIKDAFFNNLKVKKVDASHSKGEAIIFSESEYSLEDFANVLKSTGYKVLSLDKKEAIKKLFGWS